MIRDIVIYPDETLHKVSDKVEKFDEELHQLLDDMYETMIAKNGVGLAAIQVAVPLRALIINIPIENDEGEPVDQPMENTLEIVNPIIRAAEGSTKFQEGCLSVPGYYEDVERFEHVIVEYQDRRGETFVIEDDSFLSIALQHEIDHLEGRVFVEKLSYTKRKKFEKEWRKKGKKS
jgi:peptide deformylase